MSEGYSRRALLRTMAPLAALPWIGRAAGERPNILFIMSDDHASAAIGVYGSKVNQTPHLDRMAREGLRFDNCFCTNSICTPSRAVILTGEYSHLNGVKTLNDALDPERQNVAKLLRAGGYQTAVVGKWHLHKPPSGFDYSNILTGQGGQGEYFNPILSEQGKTPTKTEGYATDIITSKSLEWLENRDRNRPFFLMCHHKAPHREWAPHPRHAQLYSDPIPRPANLCDDYSRRSQAALNATMRIGEHMTRTDLKTDPPPGLSGCALREWAYQRYMEDYLRCVQAVDDGVGRMLEYLEQKNLAQDTLVIYTSDQGFFLGEHGWYDKRFMYEESLRMPLLMRYPRRIPSGSVNRNMVLNLDFAPTFLDLAGLEKPANMQGRSFAPMLGGRAPRDWRKAMYYRYWMHLAHHGVPAHYGVRTDRYKLIYYYGDPLGTAGSVNKPTAPEWELFDLKEDPREMNNVYSTPRYSRVVRELKAELVRLQKHYGDAPQPQVS
jgi:arylsulfatase A-like enzyme